MPVRFPSNGRWLVKIVARKDRFIVGVYRRHMKAIGYLGMIDRLFGVPVTTRSWNTVAGIAKVLTTAKALSIGIQGTMAGTSGEETSRAIRVDGCRLRIPAATNRRSPM
jgi:hypothetical protein